MRHVYVPAVAVATLLLNASPTSARTWIVDLNGSGDATTIQGGVNHAGPGDSVLVLPGTYREQVNLTRDDLVIAGAFGPDATIVDAESMTYCLRSNSGVTKSVISGLTFTGAARTTYGTLSLAVRLTGDAEIYDCAFRDNESFRGSALSGEGDLYVENSWFVNNFGSGDWSPDPDCGWPCIGWIGTVEVERCRFEDNVGICFATIAVDTGPVTIRNSVFVNNETTTWPGGLFGSFSGSWVVENNLFVGNNAIPFSDFFDEPIPMVVQNNTFAANHVLEVEQPIPAAPGSIIRANVFSGGNIGLHLPPGGGGIVVECNDSWGNDVNWKGFDPSGTNGNISVPPLYCNAPLDDFRVAVNSPLLPQNNECGVPIGAFGVGCGTVSIESMSWGRIKGQYR